MKKYPIDIKNALSKCQRYQTWIAVGFTLIRYNVRVGRRCYLRRTNCLASEITRFTPLDFLWGNMKTLAYRTRVDSPQGLIGSMIHSLNYSEVRCEIIVKVLNSISEWWSCIRNYGIKMKNWTIFFFFNITWQWNSELIFFNMTIK